MNSNRPDTGEDGVPATDERPDECAEPSPGIGRRGALVKGGKLLAYAAPLVLLARPRPAFGTVHVYS